MVLSEGTTGWGDRSRDRPQRLNHYATLGPINSFNAVYLTLLSLVCAILGFYVAYCDSLVGRDSSVGIATCYWLDGPGIESQLGGGEIFPHPSRPAMWPTQPLIQWVPGLSRG